MTVGMRTEMTMKNGEWSDWYDHEGGPCPIEWAGRRGYEIKVRCGEVEVPAYYAAREWSWAWEPLQDPYDIVAYRVLKSATPPGWNPPSPASTEVRP